MWLRKDLKLRAKEAVSRNYWKTVLVSALFSLIFSGGSFFTFKLGDADEIIDDIFYAFPFGLFFMFIAGLLLIAAVILFIIFIVNPLQVGISKFRINAINNLGNISDVGTGYDVSYKRNAETIFMMNLFIFLYRERPHITALAMEQKELSMIVMSEASFATVVPSPIDSPTCAALRAGASFVPSPVTATTSPFSRSNKIAVT